MTWWYPLLATFFISAVPIGLLSFVPLVEKLILRKANIKRRSTRHGDVEKGLPLSMMMSFAAGSLVTDAVHHFAELNSPETGLVFWTLAGIVFFFFVDKLGRFASAQSSDITKKASSIGYLSLIADAIHNFTDGLAIAASFSQSKTAGGISTTLAIFLHEIPHELGDYAVLAKAGYRHAKIMYLQIATALAAFIGTITGIAIEYGLFGMYFDTNILLPFTSGGFLYLGLCTILSEVLSNDTRSASFSAIFIDTGAFILGSALLQFLERFT